MRFFLLIIYARIHYYKSFAPKLPHVKKYKNLLTIGIQYDII